MKQLVLLPILGLIQCVDISTAYELTSNQCFSPTLENGWVEAAENARDNSFVGRFRCLPGFLLTGPDTVKCMNGKWNIQPDNFPLCAARTCDQRKLPNNPINGFRRGHTGYRNSVFKYYCKKGYRLIGVNKIFCKKDGWSSNEAPVCSKANCNPDHLLGQEMKHVQSVRRMYGGAAYRFKCEERAELQGSSLVFCDGQSWNGSVPQCFVAPRSPTISVFVDGTLIDERISVTEGQEITVSCQPNEGHPTPTMTLIKGDEKLNQSNITFTVKQSDNNLHLGCAASNIISTSPVFSEYRIVKLKYGPHTTYLTGDMEVVVGQRARYSCTSDESDPVSDITVVITDQVGNNVLATKENSQPIMKGRKGFSSKIQFSVDIPMDVTKLNIECRAANEVGEAVSEMSPIVNYPPTTVTISGPSIVEQFDDSSFSCMSSESNPVPTIEWHIIESDNGEEGIIYEDETLVETATNTNGEERKVSNLTLHASKLHTTTIFCIAYIKELEFEKASDEIEVVRAFPPIQILIKGSDEIIKGEPAEYTCNVKGGNPEPQVSMTVEDRDRNVIDSTDNYIINFITDIKSDMSSVFIKCLATNQAGTVHTSKQVQIHWGPTNAIVDGPVVVEEGAETIFNCSTEGSNPSPEFSWDLLNSEGLAVEFKTEHTESGSLLYLPSAEKMDRSYTAICHVSNYIGEVVQMTSSYVTYKPKKLIINGPETIEMEYANNDTVTYECSTDESFPAANLSWTLNGEKTTENVNTFETKLENGGIETNSLIVLHPNIGDIIILECYHDDTIVTKDVKVVEIAQSTDSVNMETQNLQVINNESEEQFEYMDGDRVWINTDIEQNSGEFEDIQQLNTGKHLEENIEVVYQDKLESVTEHEVDESEDWKAGKLVKLVPIEYNEEITMGNDKPADYDAVDYKNNGISDESDFIKNEKFFNTKVDHVDEPIFFRSEVESADVALRQSESKGLTADMLLMSVKAGVNRLFISNICSNLLMILFMLKLV